MIDTQATTPACDVTVVIPCARGMPEGLAGWLSQDVPVAVILLCNGSFRASGVIESGGGGVSPPQRPPSEPTAASSAHAGAWRATHPDTPRSTLVAIDVPWDGHGPTRQAALPHVVTPFVLFTVDDAVAADTGVVRRLCEALVANDWDAVTARQVPRPDADAVTRARLAAWTPEGVAAVPTERLDHVCALHRAEVLRGRPLPGVPTAEDWAWARGYTGPGLRAGVPPRLGYAPEAVVVHSHARRFRSLRTRTREEHAVRQACGEAPSVPDLGAFLRALPACLGRDARGALGELVGQWESTHRAGDLTRLRTSQRGAWKPR